MSGVTHQRPPGVFAFASAGEIRFGRGTAAEAPAAIADLAAPRRKGAGAPHVLVVHGADATRAAWLLEGLRALNIRVLGWPCAAEPDLASLEQALAAAREFGAHAVCAIGGGAAIDLGKAVAGLLDADSAPMDHLEVVGRGMPLQVPPAPFVAIPTTAGTGAEVTRNAVIGVPEHRRKVSLRDPRMLPNLAIVDPALTDGAPRGVTLASGLDAVTQVIEPFVCTRANPMTDALCRDAIPRGLSALTVLMDAEAGAEALRTARDDMALVSLFGGLALANSGLGAVHGLAGVIGGEVPGAPHGAICGALLPFVLEANATALATGDAGAESPAARIAWVQGKMAAIAGGKGAETFADWSHGQGLPRLSDMGLAPASHARVAEAAGASSSMKANPAPLGVAELRAVLERAG